MAAELEVGLPLVGSRRLEGTLVAPRTQKRVPNHLSDTKIFAKVSKIGPLQTQPGVIHFDGYSVGNVHQQTLRIINTSRDNQQMHIIPPTTPFFTIKYSKQRSSLVPGLSLEVTVQFKPNEWRYYYDSIRIHCKGDQNLLVPIHAYPVVNTAQFPRIVKFLPTAIGQSRRKTLSLECDVPVDFDFQLSPLQHHPAFTVTPMKGVVPANGRVDITVIFAPTEFNTAVLKLQLELSQFNSSPLVCTVTGSSAPGLATEQVKKSTSTSRPAVPQPHTSRTHPLPPLERMRWRKGEEAPQSRRFPSNATLPSNVEEEIVYEGFRFPAFLDTPSAVGKILAQQPGKLRASQLRQVAMETGVGAGAHQTKEAAFLQQVRQAAAEERANQLRWVTQLGGVAMTAGEREAVLQARQDADRDYQCHRHVAVPEEEYLRTATKCVHRRTRREARKRPQDIPKFDSYSNDRWLRRHLVLQQFIQAGRRVILQLRCQRRLDRMKRLGADLQAGRSLEESLADMSRKGRSMMPVVSQLPKSPDLILPFSFPKYTSRLDEDTPDALGPVEVKPTDVEVKKEVPFIDLKVPQQYKLLGYSPQPLPLVGSYIPPGLPRPLRSGAQDELQSLGHIPGVDPTFLTPAALAVGLSSVPPPPPDTAQEIRVVDMEGVGEQGGKADEREPVGAEERGEEYLPLVPPPALFKPPQRHPLHIFAPSPGVSGYVPMLPHSETMLSHILLPLPPYPTAKHPQVRLDPQDVIPGVMRWKQFPSHCLVALEGEKKLSTSWKPRWSDPFSEDLLPIVDPQLLSGPQPDDYVDVSNCEEIPVPTPDMVRAQFYIPETGTEQQDPRLAAGEKLKSEQSKQFNQLGERITQRLKAMQSLLTNSRMKTITEDNPAYQ